jgi:hypothetical protein
MTEPDLLPSPDDVELRALLDRCMSEVRAPDRLHGSALAHGRRLRTRRRAGQATGGLLAAASCTALVVTLTGGSHGTTDRGYAGDPTPTVAPAPSTEQVTPDTQRPPGWWDMPSRRMLTVLRAALPDGVTVTESVRHVEGTTERTMALGGLSGVLTGPTGPGAFQVILYAPDPHEAASPENIVVPLLTERIRCQSYMTVCEPLVDDSGAVVGRVTTDEESGTTYHEVMLLGPDGGGMYFYVGDSSGEKPGYEAPSAEAPPLSTDQLVALAQDPAWSDYVPEG